MKKVWKVLSNILSWAFVIFMLVVLAVTVLTVKDAKELGKEAYIFGYRLVMLSSGSMEPTIHTNAVVVSKKVESLEDIKRGDIVSFRVKQDNGSVVRVTHRIYNILDDGSIYTKGDNNRVIDSYPITSDDVESKVVLKLNFVAYIVNLWNCGNVGKELVIIFSGMALILLFALSGGISNTKEIIRLSRDIKELKSKGK